MLESNANLKAMRRKRVEKMLASIAFASLPPTP
jgi:hypothetical protein